MDPPVVQSREFRAGADQTDTLERIILALTSHLSPSPSPPPCILVTPSNQG